MTPFLDKVENELSQASLLSPIIVASSRCRPLTEKILDMVPEAKIANSDQTGLTGRDVVLIHAGESGWEETLELICQQSPGRLYVVAPQLPRVEALKLTWVADKVVVGEEIFEYEVHELGLSA